MLERDENNRLAFDGSSNQNYTRPQQNYVQSTPQD